jgi:hypothetical protein
VQIALLSKVDADQDLRLPCSHRDHEFLAMAKYGRVAKPQKCYNGVNCCRSPIVDASALSAPSAPRYPRALEAPEPHARLRLLCGDLSGAIALRDADLVCDCLLRLRTAFEGAPPNLPPELDGALLALADFVFAPPTPAVRAESLALLASLTAVETLRFTSLVMGSEQLLAAIAAHALAFEVSAAVILANLCGESRGNADAVLSFISVGLIGVILVDPGVAIEVKCSFVRIFASICAFPLSEEEASAILAWVVPCIELHASEVELTHELFLVLARLRTNTENAARLLWDSHLLQLSDVLRTELSVPSLITILQCYGDALQEEFPVPALDFHKLTELICHPNQTVADAAMWLLWNDVGQREHSALFDPSFVVFLSDVCDNGNVSIKKHSLLIWSELILESSQTEIPELALPAFVERACEVLAAETDDPQLEVQISAVLARLLGAGAGMQSLVIRSATQAGLVEALACRDPTDDEVTVALAELGTALSLES